jgi:hypothetical protein
MAEQDSTRVTIGRDIGLERWKQANHQIDIDGACSWIDLDRTFVFNFTDPVR